MGLKYDGKVVDSIHLAQKHGPTVGSYGHVSGPSGSTRWMKFSKQLKHNLFLQKLSAAHS